MSLVDLLLKLVQHTPIAGEIAGDQISRIAINHFAGSTHPRPRPFSLWSAQPSTDPTSPEYITDYTSWPSLTNRQYTARHLGPADPAYIASLPFDAPYQGPGQPLGDVTALFARKGKLTTSRSSLLFTFFAQWFTDSVLRFNPFDRRKNTSNHDIDLCQVYGLTENATRILRKLDGSGKLRFQTINGEDYPEYLCEATASGFQVRPQFEQLRATSSLTADQVVDASLAPSFADRKGKLYATGLERGNSSIGYVAISTIFLREHNRIAEQLKQDHPSFSDERLFQTARNINIVLLLKLVVEDYINHILGHPLFKLDHRFAEDESWCRPNWIALEFDLLYRWHSLCPDKIRLGGSEIAAKDFRNNNAVLESAGVSAVVDAASRQRAGKIGLANSPDYLWGAESLSIKMGRDFRIRPFNEYRTQFGLQPFADFDELTSDVFLQEKLRKLYKNIDQLELVVGLFAEEADDGLLFGGLLNQMVAYDAFTQIFSNPLLSRHIYNEQTFTAYGLDLIERTTTIEALVNRNVKTPIRLRSPRCRPARARFRSRR
jgi:prostaglandin-endoperoxide synthase 2